MERTENGIFVYDYKGVFDGISNPPLDYGVAKPFQRYKPNSLQAVEDLCDYRLSELEFKEWNTCSPESLRGHIVNAHFQPMTLASLGVARYDIEIAHYRGIPLDWVVGKAYAKLERPNEDIQGEIDENKQRNPCMRADFSVDMYRTMLVKDLRYIEMLGRAAVDWQRVERAFPDALSVELNLREDSHDGSFLENIPPFLDTSPRYALREINDRGYSLER